MKTVLKIALFAGGGSLLLSKLGFSLPALSGESAPASSAVSAGATTSPIMLLVKSKGLAYNAEGKLNFWEWAYYYNDVIGTPNALPGPGEYGLPGDAGLVPMTFDEFQTILRTAAAKGVGADLPGILSGLRRSY
jgi:hypothetical protein